MESSALTGQLILGTDKRNPLFLGADLHQQCVTVTRIIDRGTPEPAERFSGEQFWRFVQGQVPLARKVYLVCEAGAVGVWPWRELQRLGVECCVAHAEKLDPRQTRVQSDKFDSEHLAEWLQGYVLGDD
jgi:transposase